MTIDISIPQLNPKQKTAKDAIVSILSQEWPLSTKEIHNRAQRQLSLNISYQAVHKTIKQFEKEGIISKVGREYELNRGWISSTKKSFTNLEKLYNKDEMVYDIDPNFKGTLRFQFDDFTLLALFCAETVANRVLVGDGTPTTIGWFRHLYVTLRFNFRDFSLLQQVAKNCKNAYAIASCASPLDKWIQKMYLKSGFKSVKIGIGEELFDDCLIIHGDGIIRVVSSPKTKQILDEVYNRNRNITDLFREVYFRDALKSSMHFEVTITRDPKMAKFLRKQLMKFLR